MCCCCRTPLSQLMVNFITNKAWINKPWINMDMKHLHNIKKRARLAPSLARHSTSEWTLPALSGPQWGPEGLSHCIRSEDERKRVIGRYEIISDKGLVCPGGSFLIHTKDRNRNTIFYWIYWSQPASQPANKLTNCIIIDFFILEGIKQATSNNRTFQAVKRKGRVPPSPDNYTNRRTHNQMFVRKHAVLRTQVINRLLLGAVRCWVSQPIATGTAA